MADKAITELVAAEDITASDLFVLQQNETAKKLPGQVLLNWLTAAADGHGGIKSIVKLSTNVLSDTYRITLADTTTIDFVVNNGRGIKSIRKIKTGALVDTYQIDYTDNTSSTYTVTNGAKGDKGDNSYIWVRYAAQMPTASSHSFGDVPDAWIGLYFGTASTAPTNWQQYSWYQWKGEKGDPGDPASLVSSEIRYQVGSSGTIIPSGTWSESVPSVTPGKYLWTRQVIRFNTGSPITSYSVSRFGIDGSGAVSTVAGVSPDSNGNVPLDASSVKALPISGGTMQGAINMDGQKIKGLNAPTDNNEATNKKYVDDGLAEKVNARNVANNFTTTASGYVADARALKTLNDTKITRVLLWQNASPESSFAEQTLTIDLSAYNLCLVEVLDAARTGAKKVSAAEVIVGDPLQTRMIVGSRTTANQFSRRDFLATTSGIQIGACTCITVESAAEDNTLLIPVRVYGIKGVT